MYIYERYGRRSITARNGHVGNCLTGLPWTRLLLVRAEAVLHRARRVRCGGLWRFVDARPGPSVNITTRQRSFPRYVLGSVNADNALTEPP